MHINIFKWIGKYVMKLESTHEMKQFTSYLPFGLFGFRIVFGWFGDLVQLTSDSQLEQDFNGFFQFNIMNDVGIVKSDPQFPSAIGWRKKKYQL